MKKALSVGLLLAFLSSAALAQLGISKGLKGGLNLATVGGSDAPSGLTGVSQYAAGIYLEISLPGPLAVEGDVLYSVKGAKMEVPSVATQTTTLSYLEIPVLAKFYLPLPVIKPHIFAGPAIGFLMSAKEKDEVLGSTTEKDVKDATTSTDLGIVVGAGVKIATPIIDLSVEARYNYGLTSIDKVNSTKVYNRTVSILVGIGL